MKSRLKSPKKKVIKIWTIYVQPFRKLGMPYPKLNAKNLWKVWVVAANLSSKTKATAQNINGRAFVQTKKINKCNIKRNFFKFVPFICP